MKNLIALIIVLSIIYTVGHYFFLAIGFITEEDDTKPQVRQEEQLRQDQERPRRNTEYETIEYEPKKIICAYCDGKGIVKVTIPPPPNYSGDPDHYKKYKYETVEQTCSHCDGSGYIYR